MTGRPWRAGTGMRSAATVETRKGRCSVPRWIRDATEKTSNGPAKSSTSTSGKSRIATSRVRERTSIAGSASEIDMGLSCFYGMPDRAEAAAIVERADTEAAHERAGQHIGALIAAGEGDGFDAGRAQFQHLPRLLQPRLLDETGGRHSGLAAEHPGEVAFAHRHAIGQGLDREIGGEVLQDPFLQILDRAMWGCVELQLGAELRLAAGAAAEDHQRLRGADCHLRA